MKTLPYDVARCAGRYSFDPDAQWCPRTDDCARHNAFVFWDRAAGVPNYKGISVVMGKPDCPDFIPDKNND